jgi:hypothetical protein
MALQGKEKHRDHRRTDGASVAERSLTSRERPAPTHFLGGVEMGIWILLFMLVIVVPMIVAACIGEMCSNLDHGGKDDRS